MTTGFHSKTLAQLIIKKECYFQLIVSHLFCEGIILAWKQFPLKTIWLERNFIFSCSYRISELCELVFMKTIPAFDCKGMLFSVDCVSLASLAAIIATLCPVVSLWLISSLHFVVYVMDIIVCKVFYVQL